MWLLLVLNFALIWISEQADCSDRCCLRGANICKCKPVLIADTPTIPKHCPIQLKSSHLSKNNITVQPDRTLDAGNYTIVGIALSELPSGIREEIAWIVFIVINVPTDGCLHADRPCHLATTFPIQLGKCERDIDHRTYINVFIIQQNRKIIESDLLITMDTVRRLRLSDELHLIEYKVFRDRDLFNGPPRRGTQYEVEKCDRRVQLIELLQYIDGAYGFSEIEEYLFTPSAPYQTILNNSRTDLFVLTKHMVDQESIECEFAQEVKHLHFRSSLYHNSEKCPKFNLDEYVDNEIKEERGAILSERLQKHVERWQAQLNAEYADLYKIKLYVENTNQSRLTEAGPGMHVIAQPFAKAYWTALYRVGRITAKLELFEKILLKING